MKHDNVLRAQRLHPVIGLQLWTIRKELEDRARAFDRVAALGIEVLEPFGLGRADLTQRERIDEARRLRADAEGAGLSIRSTHTSLPDLDNANWFFDEMAELGVALAIAAVPDSLSGFTRDALASRDGVLRYADRLNSVAEVSARHGLSIGYHNHFWEWSEMGDGSLAYDVLWEALDPDVLAEVDLYWAQTAGQDPAEVVRRLGKRVQLVHIDDGGAIPGEPFQVPAGQGVVQLAEALAAGGEFIGTYLIEASTVAPGLDMFELIAGSVAWLRKFTLGMEEA
jgi:sugar phosphate isomerase/epimerase